MTKNFRNYINSDRQDMVQQTYKKNHTNMTVEHVNNMHKKWLQFNHGKYSIEDILNLVDTIIDDSDPSWEIVRAQDSESMSTNSSRFGRVRVLFNP